MKTANPVATEIAILPSSLVDELVSLKEQQRAVAKPGQWESWQDLQDCIEILFADMAECVGTTRATEMVEDQDFAPPAESTEDVFAPLRRRVG